jgi:hypothetical protein
LSFISKSEIFCSQMSNVFPSDSGKSFSKYIFKVQTKFDGRKYWIF